MFNLDPEKILVVLAVALVVIGPEKLPSSARKLGEALHKFTAFKDRVTNEVKDSLPEVDDETKQALNLIKNVTKPTRYFSSSGSSMLASSFNSTSHKSDQEINSGSIQVSPEKIGEGSPLFLPQDPRLN